MTDRLLHGLAELDPVDESRIPDGHSPEADRLLAWVLTQPHAEPRPVRRRRWLLVPAALILLGAGWLIAQPSERPHAVACYREALAAADRQQTQMTPDEDSPEALCGRLWETGQLWEDPVPESLTSCVTGTSAIAVVPGAGEDVCEALGWAPLAWDASAHEISLLNAEVHRFHLVRSCPTEEEAHARAVELLEDHGLDDWEAEIARPTTADQPCMSISINTEEQRLLLVPLPSLPDP